MKWMFPKFGRRMLNRLATLGASHPAWARLYYAFANRSYTRDQHAFLAGRKRYRETLRTPVATMTMLRRNIHRLEKGMLMRPLRTPFGESYIAETVDAYRIAAASDVHAAEIAWAQDVLREYFLIHRDNAAVDRLRAAFEQSPGGHMGSGDRIPYRRTHPSPAGVGLNALMQLAVHRRSVRWYLPTPVARECIDRAIEVAIQAPSACNRQPYEFRIIDEPGLVQQVLAIPYGTAGFRHNVPLAIVVVGKQRHFFDERDRHLVYIDAALATMGLLYALEVQGISSCCVNWPDLEDKEKAMAEALALATDERPVMLVTVGYPDPEGLVASSTKKSLDTIRRFNLE